MHAVFKSRRVSGEWFDFGTLDPVRTVYREVRRLIDQDVAAYRHPVSFEQKWGEGGDEDGQGSWRKIPQYDTKV